MCNNTLDEKLSKLIEFTETLRVHVLNDDKDNLLIALSLRNNILAEINSMDLKAISNSDKNKLSKILSVITKEDASTNASLLKVKFEIASKIKEIKKNKHASAKYLEIKGR